MFELCQIQVSLWNHEDKQRQRCRRSATKLDLLLSIIQVFLFSKSKEDISILFLRLVIWNLSTTQPVTSICFITFKLIPGTLIPGPDIHRSSVFRFQGNITFHLPSP